MHMMAADTRERTVTRPPVLLAAWGLLALLVLGLLARMLDYPLNRDENLFVTVAVKVTQWRLYEDMGFNHLPNLPYLVHAIYAATGTEHLLLTGRLVTFGFWLVALAMLPLIGRELRAGPLAIVATQFLLVGNVLLLSEPGMLAGNNFVPVALSLVAFFCLLRAIGRPEPAPLFAFLAGFVVSLTIGFKANYIFLAPVFALVVLVAPLARPLPGRLMKAVVPLALGGLVGAAPVFAYLVQDPDALFAHTVRYFTDLHSAYTAAHPDPKQAVSITQRIILAEQLWLGGANVMTLIGIAALALMPTGATGAVAMVQSRLRWPLVTALALAGGGYVIAFAPKPSFPQYFVPPIPFLLVALLCLAGQNATAETGRERQRPILIAIAALAVLASLSRLLPDLPKLARPGALTTVKLHREAVTTAAAAGLAPGDRVATLAPALALEAGLDIYPEFAAGPFVYRVAQYIPPADRHHYRAVGAADLARFLDAHPPAALLFDPAESDDPAFTAYAVSHRYRPYPAPGKVAPLRLAVRPDLSR